MSDCMIIRRGGGGKGFDPNGAVLKVITSTGCTVLVTGTGYSKTHQQADGFPRSGDANVTEHFFSIPASAFGTITVKATNTYGDNTKYIDVNTAGKVYEVLCAGLNIILNSTFGLQEGITFAGDSAVYNARFNWFEARSGSSFANLTIPSLYVAPYSQLTIEIDTSYTSATTLADADNYRICDISGINTSGKYSGAITGKLYPTATLTATVFRRLTEIILS